MALRYKYPNTYMIYRTIKVIMKDEERGMINREEAAKLLHEAAEVLLAKVEVADQPSLWEDAEVVHIDDIGERVRAHLRKNKR